MAAPNAFSGHLEKWIYEKAKNSIFCINIVPRHDQHEAIDNLMGVAGHVPLEQRAALIDGDGYSATGFVVENGPNHLKILTCANIIQHVFSAANPVSRHNANMLFHTYVLCDHYESHFREPGQDVHHERVYAEGQIIGISCRDDLMLIRVPRPDVLDLDETCLRNHPALRLSSTQPMPFDDCAMVSWPPLRYRTAVKGSVSNASRSFEDLNRNNPVGYRINLVEVKIGSEDGSAGAPLLNGNGKVIGMLHGGHEDVFSYFVRLNDIRHFLAQRGIVIHED